MNLYKKVLFKGPNKFKKLSRFRNLDIAYNNSSIAFKREIFTTEKLFSLSKIKQDVDHFIFFFMMYNPGVCFFDDKKLTIYRLHRNNMSYQVLSYPIYIKTRKERLLFQINDLGIIDTIISHKFPYLFNSIRIEKIEYKILADKLVINDVPEMLILGMWKHLIYFLDKEYLKKKMFEYWSRTAKW